MIKKNILKKDFSEVFIEGSEKSQKNLLIKIAREANRDQRKVLKEYDKKFSK